MKCPQGCSQRPNPGIIRRYGSFYRSSDRRTVQRFQCTRCHLHFSHASFSKAFGQNKRHINHKVLTLLSSGVSQRRMAKLLHVHQITIARKLTYLGNRLRHKNFLERTKRRFQQIEHLQFDDLETFEHTKLKPLSITLAVEKQSRYILGFEVSRMPAKGLLVEKSIKKYGKRKDDRKPSRERLFRRIEKVVAPRALIESDENPHYPEDVRRYFPHAVHVGYRGQRGAITGQGELKKIGFDPLFSLNHTCAMLRANVNRLFRKTWCTTKKLQPLIDHLEVYVWYHNQRLI